MYWCRKGIIFSFNYLILLRLNNQYGLELLMIRMKGGQMV